MQARRAALAVARNSDVVSLPQVSPPLRAPSPSLPAAAPLVLPAPSSPALFAALPASAPALPAVQPALPAPVAFVSNPDDELDFVSEGIVYETQRDGEGPSSVAHVPPRRRANTSSSVVLAWCRGRSLFWWSGVGVVLSVALALLVALAFCSISVAAPTELALANEWVEGGGLLVSGRRRVFFVRFVLCVAAMLYFFV